MGDIGRTEGKGDGLNVGFDVVGDLLGMNEGGNVNLEGETETIGCLVGRKVRGKLGGNVVFFTEGEEVGWEVGC